MDVSINANEFPDNKTSTAVLFATTSVMPNNSSNDNTREETIRIIQSTVASVGIFANLTVIVVFLSNKKLKRKIPNIFIVNQSSADLFCSLMLLLFSLTIKDQTQTKSDGLLGELECHLWNSDFLLWGGLLTSTWNLVCLTVERYLELVYPIWHRTHFKMRYIYMTIAFVWIFGLGLNAASAIPTATIIDGLCRVATLWPSEEVRTAWGIVVISLEFFIPLLVLISCYGKIVRVLTRRINTDLMINKSGVESCQNISDPTASAKPATQLTDPGRDKFQLARRNTIKTVLIVGICFIICWSQTEIMYFMYNCGYNINFNSIYMQFTILMVFFNCTVNPFIYLIKYKDYQEALRIFFHCNKKQEDDLSLTSSVMPSQTSRIKLTSSS